MKRPGITLLEMLVSLVVLGIIAGVAVPSMRAVHAAAHATPVDTLARVHRAHVAGTCLSLIDSSSANADRLLICPDGERRVLPPTSHTSLWDAP
jgi:prepilin-type N-terminal cleavage/methylation domain-containing protein